MLHDAAATEFRTAAVRMIAAAEYFKSAGDLPTWARAELDSWSEQAAAGRAAAPNAAAASCSH